MIVYYSILYNIQYTIYNYTILYNTKWINLNINSL